MYASISSSRSEWVCALPRLPSCSQQGTPKTAAHVTMYPFHSQLLVIHDLQWLSRKSSLYYNYRPWGGSTPPWRADKPYLVIAARIFTATCYCKIAMLIVSMAAVTRRCQKMDIVLSCPTVTEESWLWAQDSWQDQPATGVSSSFYECVWTTSCCSLSYRNTMWTTIWVLCTHALACRAATLIRQNGATATLGPITLWAFIVSNHLSWLVRVAHCH